MNFLLKIFILSSVSLLAIQCAQNVRGVAPERASLYDPNKRFQCLDGSSFIPFSQVNDDYCDCRDGSDEPGTAACMNGQFSCENLGYIVQPVPSSRVNDGICDCCDGSDEYDGKVKCENKCVELAAKMREEEEKLRLLRDQGFLKRKELIELGNEFKKTIQQNLEELEVKKLTVQTERTKLEEVKNQLESKAKEAKEKQDLIFEEKKKELEKIESERKAKIFFDHLDINKDSILQPEELLVHPELDVLFDNDGQFTLEESNRLLDQNNQMNFELFASSYYEKIFPHITQESDPKPESTGTEQEQEQPHIVENEGTDSEQHSDNEEEMHDDDENTEHAAEHEKPSNEQKLEKTYDEETRLIIDESDKARKQFEEADSQFRGIEMEINEAKKKLELDVGPNNEFAAMIDKCFEYEDREYIYKICPFEKTVQKSKSNSGETSIGNWKGWNEDASKKYNLMYFDNGQSCWNGPQRNTKVHLSCGIENKITSVSEPNRCEYEMKFETPAVCEEYTAHRVHEDL